MTEKFIDVRLQVWSEPGAQYKFSVTGTVNNRSVTSGDLMLDDILQAIGHAFIKSNDKA